MVSEHFPSLWLAWRPRWQAGLRLLVLAACLGMAAAPRAAAQSGDLAVAKSLIESESFVRARELAERMLKENPNSPIGNYLMGAAMHRGEANLPLARYYLGRAREIVERQLASGNVGQTESELFSNVLFEMLLVAGLTEKHEEQLKLVEDFRRYFDVDLGERNGWTLMKMGRYEEAKRLMMRYVTSKDPDTRRGALNTMGSIEMTVGNYEEAFAWFTQLKNELGENDETNYATLVRNRAEVATVLLKFQVAEADSLLAAKHFHPHSNSNPWMSLAVLYTGEGRLAEAISALRKMHAWDKRSDPTLEQQRWNDGQQASALVLMACGYHPDALNIIRKIRNKPDRRGVTSGSGEQAEIGLLYLYRESLRNQRERLREEMVWAKWSDWFYLLGQWAQVKREMWSVDSRLNALLVPHNRLAWIVRPYAPDSPVVEWMRSGLHSVTGPGMIQTTVNQLLQRKDANGKRERPYLLVARGETYLSQYNYAAAINDLEAARRDLPAEEVLLRGRVEALLAKAYEKMNRSEEAINAYRSTMDRDPNVLRSLEFSLPVTFTTDASPAAAATIGYLEKSPRFHPGRGFQVELRTAGNKLVATLSAMDGTTFRQASAPIVGDVKDTARTLCKDLHRRFFMPRIDLSQADVNALDGATTTGDTNSQQIRQLFGIK